MTLKPSSYLSPKFRRAPLTIVLIPLISTIVNGTLLNFVKRYKDNLRVIFDQWPKLYSVLDALSNQKNLELYLIVHAFVSIIDLTINDAKSDRDALVIQAALPMTMTVTIKVYRRCQEFAPLRPSWNFRPRRLYCEASERRQIGGISYDSSAFYTTKPISCKNNGRMAFLKPKYGNLQKL